MIIISTWFLKYTFTLLLLLLLRSCDFMREERMTIFVLYDLLSYDDRCFLCMWWILKYEFRFLTFFAVTRNQHPSQKAHGQGMDVLHFVMIHIVIKSDYYFIYLTCLITYAATWWQWLTIVLGWNKKYPFFFLNHIKYVIARESMLCNCHMTTLS